MDEEWIKFLDADVIYQNIICQVIINRNNSCENEYDIYLTLSSGKPLQS